MSDSPKVNHHYQIQKDDFDWEFYIENNSDIKRAGIMGLEAAYRHWTTYGCYENRWVKSLKSGTSVKIKLKQNEKIPVKQPYVYTQSYSVMSNPLTPPSPPKPIDLGFKIAVLVHIFDLSMFGFFTNYINHLSQMYVNNNFHIYINVVEENNKYTGDLRQLVVDSIKLINNPNTQYYLNENRGGDIGGFLLLSKIIMNSGIDYKYAIFVHSKTKLNWRKDLCQAIFNLPFEAIAKMPDVGLASCKKWIYTFDPHNQPDEYRRFKYHLIDLCDVYNVSYDNPWQFIAGTMFLIHMDIIKYIVNHNIDDVYLRLNKLESIDINWLTIVTNELKKNPKGTGNDLQYRIKFGKPLHPDYMIEHTYERIIGLICSHLGLKTWGQ